MRAYQQTPLPIKELLAEPMSKVRRRGPKRLPHWVTRAIAAIQPRVRDLTDRLGRTWDNNPNHSSLAHAHERWERERQLRADKARLTATGRYARCLSLPEPYRSGFRTTMDELQRLLDAGDWHEERPYVSKETGECKRTVYLPEDTWSAAGAVAWCIKRLDRFLAIVPRGAGALGTRWWGPVPAAAVRVASTTETATPEYKPYETETVEERRPRLPGRESWAEIARRVGVKHFGEQPDLPLTR